MLMFLRFFCAFPGSPVFFFQKVCCYNNLLELHTVKQHPTFYTVLHLNFYLHQSCTLLFNCANIFEPVNEDTLFRKAVIPKWQWLVWNLLNARWKSTLWPYLIISIMMVYKLQDSSVSTQQSEIRTCLSALLSSVLRLTALRCFHAESMDVVIRLQVTFLDAVGSVHWETDKMLLSLCGYFHNTINYRCWKSQIICNLALWNIFRTNWGFLELIIKKRQLHQKLH